MNNFKSETSRRLILQNYNTIMDMLSFDNLFDNDEYLATKILEVKRTKPFLPTKIYEAFSNFIEKHVEPIIDNKKAFEEFETSDLGHENKNGVFKFKNEMSAKLFVGRVMQHCMTLQDSLSEMAMTELRPYFE